MKKLLMVLLAIILILGISGYVVAQKNVKVKSVITANKLLNVKDPKEAKQIIKDNKDVTDELIKQGVIKEATLQEAYKFLDKMEAEGKSIDKKELTDTYLQGKVSPEQYNQITTIISKDELSISDKVELTKLIGQMQNKK